MPTWIEECVKTHGLKDYGHEFVTLENCYRNKYVDECIEKEKWAKAVDYLRIYYLNKWGGIYADADTELFENFDELLNNRMFVFKEDNGYLWNGCIGAEADHPFLKYYLNTVERNFKSDGETFDAGEQFFTESYFICDRVGLGMEIYDWDKFKKIGHHREMRSWI